jgi:antibiotic biosynthesis monooxygenase (ABM) superfamily enzyme
MIERHVTFKVHPDETEAFETLFKDEYRPAMSKMPGYVKVDLLREQEEPTNYQMVIRFVSMETAADWRKSAEHMALSPKLKSLYSKSQVEVYEVLA